MTSEQQSFINSILPAAMDNYKTYGILPSITLGQAALESGWGKYSIGNNLFGIKGTGTNGTIYAQTTEVINGKTVSVNDGFRAYHNIHESIIDHGNLIGNDSLYNNVKGVTDYKVAAQNLQSDGYATSKTYASDLINVIQGSNLNQYDSGVSKTSTSDTNSSSGLPSMGDIKSMFSSSIFTLGGVALFIIGAYIMFNGGSIMILKEGK